jgi:hypothetical protein
VGEQFLCDHNLAFGALFVLALAVVIFLIITVVERLTFG